MHMERMLYEQNFPDDLIDIICEAIALDSLREDETSNRTQEFKAMVRRYAGRPASPEAIAQIAATLMSAGQLGINDLDSAVAKAKELVKKAGL